MENNENETKNEIIKKSNRLPIILCIIIIILLLAIIFIILFNKDNGNNHADNSTNNISDNSSDNNSENESQNNNVTYEFVDIKNQLDNVYVDGKKQDISTTRQGPGRMDGFLSINGKSIEYGDLEDIIGMFMIDSYITVITRYSSFDSGANIYIYDLSGELIKNFYNLDGNNIIPTVTSFMDEAGTKYVFNISGNKMKVYGHQKSYGRVDIEVLDKNNNKHIVNICSKSELNSYGINGDTIFNGEYELIYAGKGIFNLELVEGTSRTFSDEWKAQNCN